MRRCLVVLVGGVLLLLPIHARAQRITGQLVGTVTDDSGAVLPGVTVSLQGPQIVGVQTTTSNEKGFYRFIALPPGSYELSFALSGFSTLNLEGIRVGVGQTIESNASLKLSSLAEEITVVGDASVVDTQTNQVSTNYDKDWVRNAPVPRFSMFDLIAVSPGVSPSTQGSTTMAVFGSGTDENSWQIDGTNLTAPSTGHAWPYPNTDAIEEIEVLSLGAPAEYGNVSGAVLNVVTRQGTNEFHGDANFYIQTDGLTGTNTTPDEDGGFPFHREKFHDASFQLQGPIIKDKLHFFASYQYQRDAKTPAGVDPRFFTNEKADRIFGKLNWQINSKHKLAFGYHDDIYDLPGTPSANAAPTTVNNNHGHNPTPNLMYTGVLSERTVLEARFAGFWGDDHSDPIIEGEERVQPRFYDVDTGLVTGGIYFWYDDKSSQQTLSAKVSHFADDFLGASHDFKFGVQYVRGGATDGVYGYNDIIYIYNYVDDAGQPYQYAYGYQYQPLSYGGTMAGVGAFLDDTIRVNDRLTINAGVRFDSNTAKVPDLNVLDVEGNPTGEVVPGKDLYTWNVVSPRIGFNLQLTADGKTVLKGHYGRYHRSIVTGEYLYNIGSVPSTIRSGAYDLETLSFIDPEVSRVTQNFAIGPDYQNPYTDQFAASLERALAPHLGLSLHYIYKRARKISAWNDVVGQYEDVTISNDAGQSFVVQRLVSDPGERSYELVNDPRMKTDTHAFTAQLVKRMSDGWQLTAAYTYLNSQGILPSGRNGLTSSQRATLAFSDFGTNPNDFVNAGGKLLGDRPHTFKAQLVWQAPADFLLGVNYTFQSGRAWARRARVTDPDLGFPSAPEINVEERDGSRRVPNQSLVDVRLQKTVNLAGELRFSAFVDALNLFNSSANEGVLSRTVGVDTFGVPSDFVFPRRFMLGAKLTF